MTSHAVVIGAGLAGLASARVLADHFERVTLVERDALSDEPVERAGVRQSRHIHVLLLRGLRELERLFPGFEADLRVAGAVELDPAYEMAQLRRDGWFVARPSGFRALSASRVGIEAVVRRKLRTLGRVAFAERSEVVGLISTGDSAPRICGVCVRDRDGAGTAELEAALVVDASGRGSHAGDWLGALGLALPGESVVDSGAAYSSRWYEGPAPGDWPREWWWRALWVEPRPGTPGALAGVLFPVEHNRWVLTLAGLPGAHPPTDEAGFDAALWKLRSPAIAEAVKLARPLTPVYGHRHMANRFRHYENWKGGLGGFVAVGDAFCSFNPVYGQGMSTAAVSALVLGDVVARVGPESPELAAAAHRALARFLAGPWSLATGADWSYPTTPGRRPLVLRFMEPYMRAVMLASASEPAVFATLLEVMNMVRPPQALFAPGIVGRVARRALARALGAPTPDVVDSLWPPPRRDPQP